MEKSEQAEFLKDIGVPQPNVFETTPEVAPEIQAETPEEIESKAKNRRERRLMEQNQRLREEAIAADAKLQGIREAQKVREGTETAEYLKLLEPVFGNNEPGRAEATELLKKAFVGMKADAKKELLEEIANERQKESEAVQEEEKNLDEILERVEDSHSIDMSNEAERKGFLSLLEKLSPKDHEGNIREYADPDATAEIFLRSKEKSPNRAKELASRGMTQGGTTTSTVEHDARERWLLDNGII